MPFYRRDLPHIQRGSTPLFITFKTAREIKLGPSARSIVLEHCRKGDGRFFKLHAAVVLNNHVHLLLSPLEDADGNVYPLARIMKGIKGASARAINVQSWSEGTVWLEESFDHLVRTGEEFDHHYPYILANAAEVTRSRNPFDYGWLWTENG